MNLTRTLSLLLVCAACGTGAPRTRSALDAARLQHASALGAEQRTPELWQELEAARAAAEAAGSDHSARAEHEAIARLWLEASIAECERADLAAQRLEIEREIEAIHAEALRDQQAARQLTDEAAQKAAAQLARDEAARALERAASAPVQRPRLDRETSAAAARALGTRAQLVLEAARVLGADASALAAASALRERAQAALTTQTELALELADQALSEALKTLGAARRGGPQPSAAEKQALVDDLTLLGATVQRGDRGLVAALPAMFGAGDRLSASATKRLSRVCALGVAHPNGALQLSVAGVSNPSSARRRAALLAAMTAAGCVGERFFVDAQQGDGTALELTWLAY